MAVEVRLAGAPGLASGESIGFDYQWAGELRRGFVIALDGEFHAYANFCPHWRVDLDMGEGRFYAAKVDRIYCKNHGALFEPRSGVCDHGPCIGQKLLAFKVAAVGNDLIVHIDIDSDAVGA